MTEDWDGWMRPSELVAAADEAGFRLTERQLESWRNQQKLPPLRRARQDGVRPVWLAPPDTLDQLLKLCTLRDDAHRERRTADAATLRISRWLDGDRVDLAALRSDLAAVVDDSERIVTGEVERIAAREHLTGDPDTIRWEALGHAAGKIAGRHSGDPVPPRWRSARAYRRQALQALLYLFTTGHTPPGGAVTGDDVERGLGLLPRGRLDRIDHRPGSGAHPAGPWHDATALDLSLLADIVSLPALRHAVDEADDDALLYARRAVPLLLRLQPVVRALEAVTAQGNFAGLGGWLRLPLRDTRVGLVLVVLALRRSALRDRLDPILAAVERVADQLDRALDILFRRPAHDRERLIARADPADARVAQRLIDEFGPSPDQARPRGTDQPR